MKDSSIKVTVKYDLGDEGAKHDYQCAIMAVDIQRSLRELDNELRSVVKHGVDSIFGVKFNSTEELIIQIRKFLGEECLVNID